MRPSLLPLVIAALLCQSACDSRSHQSTAPDETAAAVALSDRSKLVFSPLPLVDDTDPADLEIPGEGAPRPLVVILQAGSYECPFTREAESGIESILQDIPEAARYYLHSPQSGQMNGYLLAVAASAAQRQGRFWEFHRLLMRQAESVDQDRLLFLARRIGLDVPTFLKDLQRPEFKEHVERNRTLAAVLGLSGTPVFLVNGVPVLGWPGVEKFETLVREKLEEARKALPSAKSLTALHLDMAAVYPPYQIVMEKGVKWDQSVVAAGTADQRRYRAPVSDATVIIGPASAPVTVVEYLGPSCPHSKRAREQVRRLADHFGDRVRFVVKQSPSLGKPSSERLEIEIRRIDAIGTPVYFVNGIRRAGYQDDEELKALIMQEMAAAEALIGKGVLPQDVYGFLTSHGFSRSFLQPEVPGVHYGDVPDIDGLVSGAGSAKKDSRLLVYWRFHSAFCHNLLPHLLRLKAKRPRLSITVKPLILPDDDLDEAIAYLCAADKGLAVPMLQALAAVPGNPADRDSLVSTGRGLGVEPGAFASCMEDPAVQRLARSLRSEATAQGIKGAPVVFVGRRRVSIPSGLDYYSLLAAVEESQTGSDARR